MIPEHGERRGRLFYLSQITVYVSCARLSGEMFLPRSLTISKNTTAMNRFFGTGRIGKVCVHIIIQKVSSNLKNQAGILDATLTEFRLIRGIIGKSKYNFGG